MQFQDLAAFDAWLIEPVNLQRLLPFPRCVVAFRVRREMKEHDMSLAEFIQFTLNGEGDLDKLTFLYLRNGEQVWRLKTAIEFGAQLFPDLGRGRARTGQGLRAQALSRRPPQLAADLGTALPRHAGGRGAGGRGGGSEAAGRHRA
jgi:hypothetical protein